MPTDPRGYPSPATYPGQAGSVKSFVYYDALVDPTKAAPVSINGMIAAASVGDVIVIPSGVYRESVVLSKVLTLQPETAGTVYISGADVWPAEYWSRPSSSYGAWVWVSRLTVAALTTSGHGSDWTKSQYAVWVDGEPLIQVGAPDHPRLPENDRQFSVDNFGRVVLGIRSPYNHLIEVSVRANTLTFNANGTVSGLQFLHGASSDTGSLSPFPSVNFNSKRVTFTQNIVQHNKGIGLGGNVIAGSVVSGNEVAWNGVIGADISGSTAISGAKPWGPTYFQNNNLHHNNTLGESTGWTGGGLKYTSFDGMVCTDNLAWANNGVGLWGDINNTQAQMQRNKCWFNELVGVMFEVSGKDSAGFSGVVLTDISDNDCWENGWTAYAPNAPGYGGIFISTSRNVAVHDNRVAWNAQGISIWWDASRTDKPNNNENVCDNIPVYNNYVAQETSFANNSIWSLAGSVAFRDSTDNASSPLFAASNNVGGHANIISASPAEANNYYAWGGSYQNAIAAFNATRGGNDGSGASILTTLAAMQTVLAQHGIPTTALLGHGVASFGTFNSEQRPYPRYVVGPATVTLDVWDRVVFVDCTGGNVTLTLPNATAYAFSLGQRPITVFRLDAGANTLTVAPPTGQIDGAANITIAASGARDIYSGRTGTTHTYRSK